MRPEKAEIFYKDIGDYLSREEKLRIVSEGRSILNPALNMTRLTPNEHGDWLSQRNDIFSTFIAVGDKEENKTFWIYGLYCRGLETSRDAWTYNSDKKNLSVNIQRCIKYYNSQLNNFKKIRKLNPDIEAKDFISYDDSYISWSRAFINDIQNERIKVFNEAKIVHALYRPFFKQHLYFCREMNNVVSRMDSFFPTSEIENKIICISGIGGNKENSTLITSYIPDLNCLDAGTQCFPLYWYEKKEKVQGSLFERPEDEYIRRDGISDFILDQAKSRYGFKVTKEDIFYYVYGILHSPGYRKTFANDLKKMLPRLPLVETSADFWAFSEAGRKLAELHLNYEDQPPLDGITINGKPAPLFPKPHSPFPSFTVTKMAFPAKGKTDTINYNADITISNIPEKAYQYIVNGKSAIEWVMERYAVTTHKESGIQNDPNDWAVEHGNPRYILDLTLSVITVSVKTVDIVAGLPKLNLGS